MGCIPVCTKVPSSVPGCVLTRLCVLEGAPFISDSQRWVNGIVRA